MTFDFNKLKKDFESFEEQREELIRTSRDIIRLSKKTIYSVHRADMKEADKSLKELKQKIGELEKFKEPKLVASASYKIALQEYIEALCYLEYVKNGKIVPYNELGVDHENYLLGICDLTGELVRKALSAGIDGKFSEVKDIRNFVNEIYDELINFDFRNSELRRKVDSIRWDLKKLDEMVLQMTLKEK